MSNILYFGHCDESSTAGHRAYALRRMGHEVTLCDPYKASGVMIKNRLLFYLNQRVGFRILQSKMLNFLKCLSITPHAFKVIWINHGELFGLRCLKYLRGFGIPIVLYNNDDPTGGRDGRRFDMVRQAMPCYDLCAVLRQCNVAEYKLLGALNVIRVFFSYDEVQHRPFENTETIPEQYRTDVAFVGTWMRGEDRDGFLMQLIRQGVSVSIWGDRWQKSPLWGKIRSFYRGGTILNRDYVAALQGAKICIGLLSKGNRDLHTTRSVEIPYAGGLLCGMRTADHEYLFRDGVEAVLWSTADECAHKCKALLDDGTLRESIRIAGMKRIRDLGVGNEDICRNILNHLEALQANPSTKSPSI